MIGVVAAVGDQAADWANPLDQPGGDADVIDVSRRQKQNAWTPVLVGQRVELARPAAARVAKRLGERPPFPPAAERWALMCVLSIAAPL